MICPATLPKVGDKVNIVGAYGRSAKVLKSVPPLQLRLYGSADAQVLPTGFDGGCTLEVQYADGTTDSVSAATAPMSEFDEAMSVAAIPLYVAAQAALTCGFPSVGTNYDQARERLEAWLAEDDDATSGGPLHLATALAARQAEASELTGEYWGASAESDEGDQAIRVHLRLGANGSITGCGRDDADGSYKITIGRWAAAAGGVTRLAWKEVYDEGFEAICFGEYDAASGKIEAKFSSSRNVGGSFTLAKKPSVF